MRKIRSRTPFGRTSNICSRGFSLFAFVLLSVVLLLACHGPRRPLYNDSYKTFPPANVQANDEEPFGKYTFWITLVGQDAASEEVQANAAIAYDGLTMPTMLEALGVPTDRQLVVYPSNAESDAGRRSNKLSRSTAPNVLFRSAPDVAGVSAKGTGKAWERAKAAASDGMLRTVVVALSAHGVIRGPDGYFTWGKERLTHFMFYDFVKNILEWHRDIEVVVVADSCNASALVGSLPGQRVFVFSAAERGDSVSPMPQKEITETTFGYARVRRFDGNPSIAVKLRLGVVNSPLLVGLWGGLLGAAKDEAHDGIDAADLDNYLSKLFHRPQFRDRGGSPSGKGDQNGRFSFAPKKFSIHVSALPGTDQVVAWLRYQLEIGLMPKRREVVLCMDDDISAAQGRLGKTGVSSACRNPDWDCLDVRARNMGKFECRRRDMSEDSYAVDGSSGYKEATSKLAAHMLKSVLLNKEVEQKVIDALRATTQKSQTHDIESYVIVLVDRSSRMNALDPPLDRYGKQQTTRRERELEVLLGGDVSADRLSPSGVAIISFARGEATACLVQSASTSGVGSAMRSCQTNGNSVLSSIRLNHIDARLRKADDGARGDRGGQRSDGTRDHIEFTAAALALVRVLSVLAWPPDRTRVVLLDEGMILDNGLTLDTSTSVAVGSGDGGEPPPPRIISASIPKYARSSAQFGEEYLDVIRDTVYAIRESMKARKFRRVEVVGYSCRLGTREQRERVALQRAHLVVAHLEALGIDRNLIVPKARVDDVESGAALGADEQDLQCPFGNGAQILA